MSRSSRWTIPGRSSPADARQVAHVVEERVHERSGSVAGRRVDHEPRGLVDRENVLVLVENRERNRLGLDRCDARLRDVDLDLLAGADHVRALGRHARKPDGALSDQLLDPGPGEVRAGGHEEEVEPRALRGDSDSKPADHASARRRRERKTSMPTAAAAAISPMNCEVDSTPGIEEAAHRVAAEVLDQTAGDRVEEDVEPEDLAVERPPPVRPLEDQEDQKGVQRRGRSAWGGEERRAAFRLHRARTDR